MTEKKPVLITVERVTPPEFSPDLPKKPREQPAEKPEEDGTEIRKAWARLREAQGQEPEIPNVELVTADEMVKRVSSQEVKPLTSTSSEPTDAEKAFAGQDLSRQEIVANIEELVRSQQ
ncbi:MAG: hypothetical protein NT135_00665 [Candidatus Berkelbacteria bacterium]|nr:hypothetical protein [Candidatus Berkelbacteria bacterium]